MFFTGARPADALSLCVAHGACTSARSSVTVAKIRVRITNTNDPRTTMETWYFCGLAPEISE
jgi:hypothetical protein